MEREIVLTGIGGQGVQLAAKIPPAEIGSIEIRPIRPIREAPNAHRK